MERKIKKVAIYVRKSREEETEETLKRQLAVLIELCERNGWEYEKFMEVGSSQDLDREELQKMLEKVKLFYFDGIVVADLDRLSRNVVHFGQIKEVLISAGVVAITPNKVYDFVKQEDDLFSDLQSVLAKNEYQTIKRRLVRGMRQSAKQGNWVGKKVPVGYRYNRDTKRLEPSKDAPIIRRMFELYREGMSTKDIAYKFTFDGVTTVETKKTKNGEREPIVWTPAGISRLLNNPVYVGHSLFGKTSQKKVNGKRVTEKTNREEQILVKNTHEPIVPQEIWDEVQRIKAERNSRPVPLKLGKHKFSGLIRCGLCNGVHSFQTSRYKRKRISSCQTRHYSEDLNKYTVCENKGCNVSEFEEAFHFELGKYAQKLEEYIDLIKQNGSTDSVDFGKEIESKQKQIKKLRQEIKRVQQGFRMEIYTEEEAHQEIKHIRGQIKALESQIEKLQEKEDSSELDYLEQTLSKMKRFLTHGDELPEREANDILKDFIEAIIYTRTDSKNEINIVMKELN